MSVTLEFAPEVEAALLAQAVVQGVPIETYLQTMIEQLIPPLHPNQFSMDEFEAFLDELSEGSENMPVLTREALTREVIYADHD